MDLPYNLSYQNLFFVIDCKYVQIGLVSKPHPARNLHIHPQAHFQTLLGTQLFLCVHPGATSGEGTGQGGEGVLGCWWLLVWVGVREERGREEKRSRSPSCRGQDIEMFKTQM